jgi:uncharacterized protein
LSLPPRRYDGFVPGRHEITAVGQGGFRFADISHKGSILVLPSGIHRWAGQEPLRHADELYEQVFAAAAEIDILLIGSGAMPVPLPNDLRSRFREHGISADVMISGAAASTYNVLMGEGRRVAAALVAIN